MKRRLYQKFVAMALTGTMAIGMLTGCGSSQETAAPAEESTAADSAKSAESTEAADSADAQEQDSSSPYTDYSGGFPETVTIQIPVYDRAFEGWNVTDNTYTQWIQKEFGDKYNVNVEYVAVGRSTEVADYMQMLSAGNAPDIIMHYDMPQAVNYYSEGAMQALDLDEIAYYAPTYYANMKDTIDTYGEMDGENYFFFANRPTYYYNWVTLIRQDWLDAVDADMPESMEELNEVAAKWKDAGVGTLGERLLINNFTYYYPFIGSSVDEKELALYSDLAVAPLTWSATEAYLKNLNYQYNNGLTNPEFYLIDDDAKWKADFVSGKVGTYSFYITSGTDTISSLLANDADAKVSVMNTWAGVPEGNNSYYYEYPPYGMIMGINSDCTDEQREAVWMFLEWMSQSDNLFKLQNGVEGESYTLDDNGLAIPVDGYTGEWKRSDNNNKDYWCLVVEAAVYDDDELTYQSRLRDLAPSGYEYLIADSKNYFDTYAQYGLINTAYTKTIEASAENAEDLKKLWQELYVDCATCSEADFDAIYQEACQTYLDAGYQDILDEKQALYDEGSTK
ncbi:ABC transporter substrate-binding protein [Kineothrix sedimenti]|uniref:ABC transporter substrate-binding protein n=1 Tax=Kineothrix sedimenti TaxID=3123317 RepID=A0ABZ3EY57_9FIRM